jgi:hypothetical protein
MCHVRVLEGVNKANNACPLQLPVHAGHSAAGGMHVQPMHPTPCDAAAAAAAACYMSACRRSFAVDQGKGKELGAALLKLEEQNKASLNVDSWYSAYHHSHPHLVERLAAIDADLKKRS